jgi:hypothetical protein
MNILDPLLYRSLKESKVLFLISCYMLMCQCIKKGSLVHITPTFAWYREGSDHFGSYVHSISLHFWGCFQDLYPWPHGHKATTLPLHQVSPSWCVSAWYKNFQAGPNVNGTVLLCLWIIFIHKQTKFLFWYPAARFPNNVQVHATRIFMQFLKINGTSFLFQQIILTHKLLTEV